MKVSRISSCFEGVGVSAVPGVSAAMGVFAAMIIDWVSLRMLMNFLKMIECGILARESEAYFIVGCAQCAVTHFRVSQCYC